LSLSHQKVRPALAGAVGQRRDAAVVLVAAAVEDDALDAGSLGALGDELADLAWPWRSCRPRSRAGRPPSSRRRPASADQVVDDLDGDVLGRAGDDQARTLGVPETFLRPRTWRRRRERTRAGGVLVVLVRSPWLLTSLSDLAADVLAGVADALALVRLGLAELADVGGDLADELLVDARRPERVGPRPSKVMPSGALTVTGWL
jgi:hypothetical protein